MQETTFASDSATTDYRSQIATAAATARAAEAGIDDYLKPTRQPLTNKLAKQTEFS
jgi:hypothetical protein